MQSQGVQLQGDFDADSASLREHLVAQLQQNLNRDDKDFLVKFAEVNEARAARNRRNRPGMRARGVQIGEILNKLGEEVFRPDNITYATYNKMLRDSEVQAAYSIIINATLSRGWEINGGKREIRDWFINQYKRLPMNSTFEQVLSAVAYGFSATEKRFKSRKSEISGPFNTEIYIDEYAVLPPWTITFLMMPTGQMLGIRQYRGMAAFGSPASFDVAARDGPNSLIGHSGIIGFPNVSNITQGGFQPMNAVHDFRPQDVNIFIHRPNFGNPFGQSALKPAYTDWTIKEHLLTFQAEYMQIMAGGHIIGKAGHSQVDEMRDELVLLQSSGVAAIPLDQELEIHWPPGSGSPFMEAISYHDSQIMKAMLVPVLIMGQKTQFGSRSLGETHFELFKLIRIHKMQQELSRWVQNDINSIAAFNWGIVKPEDIPSFTFKAWSTTDLEQMINMIKKAADMGLIGYGDITWIREMLEMPDITSQSEETMEKLKGIFPLFPSSGVNPFEQVEDAGDEKPGPQATDKIGGRSEAQKRKRRTDEKQSKLSRSSLDAWMGMPNLDQWSSYA